MRNLMCLVVAGALLALTACSGKRDSTVSTGGNTKEMVLGKWEYVSGDGDQKGSIVEFKDGGEIEMSLGGQEAKGKYKFIEADVIEIDLGQPTTISAGGTAKASAEHPRLKVSVNNDELVMRESTGKRETRSVSAPEMQSYTERKPKEAKYKRVK